MKMNWIYDEFRQVGKDYGEQSEVDVYDSSHADFRDVDQENELILQRLSLKETDVVADIGTGTGEFAMKAASRCSNVYAVDVSKTMLELAEAKSKRSGILNIEFCLAGFLTFEPTSGELDVIATSFALHHLPDFWKGVALERLHRFLRPGGRLFIRDVVIEESDALRNIQSFIDSQAELGGDFLREDAEGHFRDEFSTYDWVMKGLLNRAGFKIAESSFSEGFIAEYHCVKT